MKIRVLLLAFLSYLPFSLWAQNEYPLAQPVPLNTQLLNVGNHIIMVHSLDLKNKAQKWVTLDSSLNEVAAKKLLTPDADHIVNQVYLESTSSIIRIDQLLIEKQLYVNAYIFDVHGNLIQNKAIEPASEFSNDLIPAPFYITQSDDNNVIAFTQAHSIPGDSLLVFNIVLNNQLKQISNTSYTVAYNTELQELYMPFVNNKAFVFIPIVDKFKSYKLGAVFTCHLLVPGEKKPKKIDIEFDRIKVKGLQFHTTGETLYFSALISNKGKKEDVAGQLYAGYDIQTNKFIVNKTFTYSQEIKDELKKTFGFEKRKGNLLNYISPLPEPFSNNVSYGYAFLLPAPDKVKLPAPKSAPPPLEGMGEIRQRMANIDALVGTQPRGSDKPLTYIEAVNHVAMMQGSGTSSIPNTDNYYKVNQRSKPSVSPKDIIEVKNILHFSFNDSMNIKAHNFLRIKQLAVPAYNFFLYSPEENGYSALHYTFKSTDGVYLQKTFISHSGLVEEKKIYACDNKILLSGFDFILNKNNLVTFYEDKSTGQMGLLKIKL